jgi:hypothetical protein
LGCLLLGAAGCGGFGPGDYNVYRIAFQAPTLSAGCYAAGQVPVNEEQDTSNEFIADTWILYMGPDDKAYLDVGSTTVQGNKSGDDFSFSGQRTDVEIFDDGMGGVERTETRYTSTDVTLKLTGKVVEGVMIQTEDFSCTGNNCPENLNCTTTTNFVGGQVDDVELEHEV